MESGKGDAKGEEFLKIALHLRSEDACASEMGGWILTCSAL
jgi:hypothetical protein